MTVQLMQKMDGSMQRGSRDSAFPTDEFEGDRGKLGLNLHKDCKNDGGG